MIILTVVRCLPHSFTCISRCFSCLSNPFARYLSGLARDLSGLAALSRQGLPASRHCAANASGCRS